MLALSFIGKACITLLFSACMVGFGRVLFGRWMRRLDAFAEIGVAGILGLGTVGLLTLPIGLLPNGLRWCAFVVWGCAAVGAWGLPWTRSIHPFFSRRANQAERLFALLLGAALLVCVGIALVSVITPSVETDWDSLSYHLAVPKLWLKAGQITPVSFIHHSNFPFTVDNLYIWGLSWGDQAAAKAFELCYYVFGILSVFGFARQRYGAMAGGWAALAFATVPVILWEAGTGYIDTAHGLYTGLGAVLAIMSLEEIANRKLEIANK